MMLLTVLAAVVFVAVALLVYLALTPQIRGIAGKRNSSYTPQELPTDSLRQPQPEPESESGFPWAITRKIEAGIPLSSEEEWVVLMSLPVERWR